MSIVTPKRGSSNFHTPPSKKAKTPNSASSDESAKKTVRYYPIFERSRENQPTESNKLKGASPGIRKNTPRRRTPLLKWNDQYAIDAGQRDFDATQCKVCNMIYTVGEITDEKHHSEYHDLFVNGLRYSCWKQERALIYLDDGSRVISVRKGDPKYMIKKVDDIFTVADLELGIKVDVQSSIKDSSLYLLYVTLDKRIAGFVAAEGIKEASHLISDDAVSTETVPAEIGVSRLWVHPNYRRQQVASTLLDVLRANFFRERILERSKLAFSDPTVNGKDFAKRYTGINNFLVFQYQT
ncbi:N-acetyltransferase ESCO2-like protein [Leptotrombidium deliense]|uniref:N-acetyltransferase ESCO2-like protein n=1 Tax=Leptotrombidium deliense TaxID=299467 RepID=A0A443SC05_9ACAR|nr:N-acetyltransferase ESCO2-like protein [Leptotrombidium deliense]